MDTLVTVEEPDTLQAEIDCLVALTGARLINPDPATDVPAQLQLIMLRIIAATQACSGVPAPSTG